MSASKVHTANLYGNEAHGGKDHPDLGCVFRCGRHGSGYEHRHRENGYTYTKANYASAYNIDFQAPGPARNRFDAEFRSVLFRGQRGWDPRHKRDTWFIGGAKPHNYHKGNHPFGNQHHHILPVGAFHDQLDHEELILLMLAGYNINCGENLIILPTEERIGRVMEMLIHPTNHRAYSASAKNKVKKIKSKLSKAADDEEEGHHPVEEDEIPNLKSELIEWSKQMWGTLYIAGKTTPGAQVNTVQSFVDPND